MVSISHRFDDDQPISFAASIYNQIYSSSKISLCTLSNINSTFSSKPPHGNNTGN